MDPVVVTKQWSEAPPRGSGWWQVHHIYKTRDIVDGGVLCSPGRWHPKNRTLPDLGDVGKDLITAMGVNLVEFEQKAYKMFAGRLVASPFSPEQIAKGKVVFKDWCKSWGYPGEKQTGDVDQEINMRLLQSFLFIADDPEAPALDCYATGVFLDHNRRMPRTPAVFEERRNGVWAMRPRQPLRRMGEEL